MAETNIEWADFTFNPWEGCTKVGPGCDHCYAETRNKRFHGGNWGPGAPRRRTSEANWRLPLKWNREAAKTGTRFRVFCASLADVFDKEASHLWREDLWTLIEETENLDWLLLTKRIGNVSNMVPSYWMSDQWPRNAWLGATVVNQVEADRDILKLLNIPAHTRFLSMEPLLSAVDLTTLPYRLNPYAEERKIIVKTFNALDGSVESIDRFYPLHSGDRCAKIDWVICGGESGTGARPMHPEWARSLRDQCVAAGVPFHFKQWGEFAPNWFNDDDGNKIPGSEWIERVGKKAAGRTLDGRTWDEFPGAAA